MSTFSSLGSKGGKPKFQSLDINRIYKSSRGESSEKTQQKSTIQYKHGMQILGKVPNARRPPANLPSLKSEHSGSEAAVPLVPPGGPGWGKQDSNSSPNGLPVSKQDHIPPPTLHQAGAQPSQIVPLKQEVPHVPSAPVDKSWSSVMSRGDAHSHHPPPYQGPQFQHDFPSLSATEGGQNRGAGTEAPYSSGLSLRPQTEGSWIGGGSGPGGEGKPASGHLGSPPQLSAQAGLLQQQQQQTLPPQYRGVMPSFMYKNSPPAANAPPSLMANHIAAAPHENTGRQDNQHFNTKKNFDEVVPPSIIKEEELHRMDEIERDMGWAYSDDIDYNKKLNFSDDEILTDKSSRSKQMLDNVKNHEKPSEVPKKEINDAWQTSNKGHSSEEEEIKLKRTQHFKEVELAVQRAKQRKKEEEKRFNEATKQGAQQKLKELEEKISKRDRDGEESVGTINPSIVPPKPIAPTEIPLPDFQREKDTPVNHNHKEKEERHKVSVESHDDKIEKSGNTFKHLTEIEGKTFKRNSKGQDSREQGAPTFSRQFQNDLPPRFKRQHNQQNVQSQYTEHYETRSQLSPNYTKSGISRKAAENEPRKVIIDEPVPIPQELAHKSESLHNVDAHDLEVPKHKKETRIQEEKCEKIEPDTKDYEKRDYATTRNRNEVAPPEIKPKPNKNQDNLYVDRFQRFDSQEPKMQREKYTSDDNREYNSWTESRFEISFEEKRRDNHREDRRQVPGPITRDRIEADDLNESRNLTALKRGQIPEKKPNGIKNKEEKNSDSSEIKNTESVESKISDQMDKLKNVVKKDEKDNKSVDMSKKNMKNDDHRDRDDKRNSNRNKMYPMNKAWNNEYHHRSTGERGNWPKRSNSNNKNSRSNVGHKPETFSNIATDSECSSEEHHAKDDHSHKNVKSEKLNNKNYPPKEDKRNPKTDKDRQHDRMQDMKRDNYVPRGEPSRLGRGGGNFRGRVGLSKRIDGYGPPPSKSPFTHHDDKRPGEIEGEAQQIVGNVTEYDKDVMVEVKGEEPNVTSENKIADDKDSKTKFNKNVNGSKVNNSGANTLSRKPNQQSRSANGEKKHFVKNETSTTAPMKQGKPDDSNVLCSAIADISLKTKDDLSGDAEEEGVTHGDSDGFQEVKSKKTVKDRPRVEDKMNPVYPGKNLKSEVKEREKGKKSNPPQIQQPIHNIPPLMAVTVNPPHVLPQPNKNQFDRQNRQNKIPPRFVKLRENNRLQKMQQQHSMPDVNDMKNRNMFGPKMSNPQNNNPVVPISNAWDKPLGTQLRPIETENLMAGSMDGGNSIEHPSAPGNADVDKKINKSSLPDAVILDGATPPVNTIIFENTNYKSMPSNRNVRNDKLRKEDNSLENQSITNFNKRMNDLLNKNDKQSDAIQLQLPFKEDSGDMKLDFFDSALSLPDEKALKNPCLTRPMHSMTSGGNDISTADALNYKIQSVKKVWETPSEHGVPPEDANSNFTTSFVPDTNALDTGSYVKGNDNVDDNHEQHGYNPATNQQTSNNTTNVCKVKPTQQVSGATNQAVSSTNAAHPAHSGIMGPGLMGNPLSPPPIQQVIGATVGIGQPPQQFPTNQHIGYQTGLGSRSQYGMSTIPSPPSVLPYTPTAPPLQPQTANLYGPFQIDQAGVLGGQGRSQFSQYPNHYGLGQAASSPYSQSMFLQTPQAHPPPAAQGPEMYPNINSYRLSTAAFGQNQQLNNPTTVLISSTSNSLMSASVKPSTQQISAIGTKSGGVGQAYQQQSQQGQQMFMFDPNIQANYLQGLQRPTGPVQNNVVPTIQPSSSYYSGSTPTPKPFNCSWGY